MKGPLSCLAILALAASPALAEESAPQPTPAVIDGELHVALKNTEYVKVQVNGEEYDNIEFEKNGKVVLIKGLSLALERNNVTLLPTDPALKSADLEVLPKDFKKKRKGKEVFLVANMTMAFEKAPADAPPTPEPKKQPDPVGPPPPKKGDL
jgi:hypothetical protein